LYHLRVKPFQKTLLDWYQKNKRALPWRKTRNPYRILTSEIMLQQTQVKTVIPYYEKWIREFPSFGALAKAPLGQVLKSWEGLGYYSRARNFHALAGTVMKNHEGALPDTFDSLKSLPGIGRYTAGAILSIAFSKKFPVLDGNVMRVLTRHFAIKKNISEIATQKELWALAEEMLPNENVGDYNQALMELGATVCTPKNPVCTKCPAKASCRALQWGIVDKLPMKTKSAPTPHHSIGAGVIWKDGRILISQRPLKGLLGGLWEFPGGKKEKGETISETVRREIKEELGVKVSVGKKLLSIPHAYSHFKITLHVHECTYRSGNVQALEVQDWRWVRPVELTRFAFPAANQPIIRLLLDKARSAQAGETSPPKAARPSKTRKTRPKPERP
jgi:A/G-specific adenine glycosylase